MGRAFEYRKARKMARWDKMAKTFSRIGKEIAIAVRQGGPEPENNPTLRRVIQNARGANMPKDNIDRAIKKASGEDAQDFQEITYEGHGQGGVAFFVECTSDNPTRTVANVRAIFNKYNGTLGKNGELSFIFDRKGIFTIEKTEIKMPFEEFEMETIDSGAEDFDEDEEEGLLIVTTAFEDFGNMSHKLEELGVQVQNSELQRIPNMHIEVPLEQGLVNLKMFDAFMEDDDVQNVYHNMEMTEELISNEE